MGAPHRRLLSYPVSLAVVVATLVAATGGFAAWWNYRAGRENVDALAQAMFEQAARQTADATRDLLGRAPPAAETLRRMAFLDTAEVPREMMARRLLAFLRANPRFTWVSWSDTAGAFTGAYRPAQGGLRVNMSQVDASGVGTADEYDVSDDDRWSLREHKASSKYDPRTRPFYVDAVKAGKRIWTPPYAFFEGVPGITCAEPVYGPDGQLRGVVTIDFDLNQLGGFVRELAFTPRGRVAVLADEGIVIAHPTVSVVAKMGAGGEAKLVTTADVADPALAAAVAGGATRGAIRRFTVDGTPYLARAVDIAVDDRLRWTALAYAPEDDFTSDLLARVASSMVISVAAVIVAVLIAWLLARRVSGPLIHLAGEMDHVGQFHLEDRPERHSAFREIEMMYGALARMKGGLRSFASYVPRDLVRAVLASGHEARLSGEVRQMTVYFSDLAGFTSIAEVMSPRELVEFLGGYFDDMSRIIATGAGTVDKYLGDGIMAFWGAPEQLPSHATDACRAALACRRRVLELAAKGMPLEVRIGLATGDVLVGNIGSSERMNYTVMGDTANLASRLEGLNKQYGTTILISEGTWLAAKEAVVARPIDVVAVKGKVQGVRVYELLALTGDDNAAAVEKARVSTEALDAYLARDFARAASLWDQIGDGPARVMRDRAGGFVAHPPPANWDGVTIATEK